MSLRIVCRNYIRQNYSWECWRKFCVLVGGGDDDGSESGKRGAAFRWSQCVPKSKYHSDCWFHICQNRIPSSYHTTCSHTHTLTLAQQIMHVWDFRIRLVHFFFRSLVVLCVCINVSINDLRVPILFRFSRTMTMVREYVLRVVSHSYLSWNLFISAGLLQLLARLFFFASSLHSFLKYFPIGVDVFFSLFIHQRFHCHSLFWS